MNYFQQTCYRISILVSFFLLSTSSIQAQDIQLLVNAARIKIEKVSDYIALGKMTTNVSFLKIPPSDISIFFKKPGKFKIKSAQGLSFVPKGAVSINLHNLLGNENVTIIDAGTEKLGNTTLRIAKLLPDDTKSDVILSILYIDPVQKLIRKVRTTTRTMGTYEVQMTYGRFSDYALPDQIIFTFNTKEYKLPKGVTFDFDDGKSPKSKPTGGSQEGSATILISHYKINKGVPDSLFQ